mmetsp:Transcript_22814/g.47597  ORF Transcript_22814/g.47597 Transcript_22814/m.47597 type:complete len:231 (+) Transcript_22814:244-936(+)
MSSPEPRCGCASWRIKANAVFPDHTLHLHPTRFRSVADGLDAWDTPHPNCKLCGKVLETREACLLAATTTMIVPVAEGTIVEVEITEAETTVAEEITAEETMEMAATTVEEETMEMAGEMTTTTMMMMPMVETEAMTRKEMFLMKMSMATEEITEIMVTETTAAMGTTMMGTPMINKEMVTTEILAIVIPTTTSTLANVKHTNTCGHGMLRCFVPIAPITLDAPVTTHIN